MLLTTLALAALWAPGGALLHLYRTRCPADKRAAVTGLWPAIAWGYVLSFLLLSPCSLLIYTAGHGVLRLAWFALLLVIPGAVYLARVWIKRMPDFLRALRERPLWLALAILANLWILFNLLLHVQVGGFLDGDATFHVGRIRDLLDHGASNRDFMIAPYRYHPTYVCNLLHLLLASIARVTGLSPWAVWHYSLPFFTALLVAAHYVLGAVVSRSATGGYLLALAMVTMRAPVTYMVYPNMVALHVFLPLGLAAVVLALSRLRLQRSKALSSDDFFALLPVAACFFLLSQVHGLYVLYAMVPVIAIAVTCLAMLLASWLRERWPVEATLRRLALLGLAMAFSVPLVFLSARRAPDSAVVLPATTTAVLSPTWLDRYDRQQTRGQRPPVLWQERSPDDERSAALRAGGGPLEKRLSRLPSGQYVMHVRHVGGPWLLSLGLCGALCGLWFDRSRRFLWAGLGGALAALAFLLFVPALCTWTVKISPAPFVVARLASLLTLISVVTITGCLAHFLMSLSGLRAPATALVGAVVVVLAGLLPGHAPRSWPRYRQTIVDGEAIGPTLAELDARAALLRAHVPQGATVLTDPRLARYIAMVHGVYVISAERNLAPAPDLGERRRDLRLLLHPFTPTAIRRGLLTRYDANWAVVRSHHAARFRWAEVVTRGQGLAVMTTRR